MLAFFTDLLMVARLVLPALILMALPLRSLVALNLKLFLRSLGLLQVAGSATILPVRTPVVQR
jgi:hypothetical protein